MKFTKNIITFTFMCVVFISLCNFAQPDESAEAAAASDFYAKYYEDYYNSIAGKEDTDQHTGYHEPHAAIYPVASYADEKQEAFDFLGPEPGITLGLIGAALGAIATVGVLINANSVNSLSNDQDSICTTAKAVGDQSFTALTDTEISAISSTATTSNAAGTKINTIIAALNAYATPSC